MTDPYLSVVASTGGTMQSNEIASTGVGVEVKAGVTGFGLPSVELQFDEAVGDGARFRGQRVLQRSVDLRFHVYGPTRADLKSTLDRISTILGYQVTLTFHDPDADEDWVVKGYRSGGGDYAYGNTDDTESGSDGQSWCNLVVTILTESPYWESPEALSATTSTSATLALPNPGTKASPPLWEVQGPSLGFKAVSPSGEVLEVPGYFDSDTTLTIDCDRGTIVDNHGANRYGDLAPLPKFWHIPEGEPSVEVTIDLTSAEYVAAASAGRRNRIINPKFGSGDAGWETVGFTYDAGNNRLEQTAEILDKGRANRPSAKIEVDGLTEGENYVVIIRGSIDPGKYGPGARRVYSSVAVIDGGVVKKKAFRKIESGTDYVFEFTAEATTATFRFVPDHAVAKNGKHQRSAGYISNVYLGEPGGYFDGGTLDTAETTYAWEGAAGASVSTATPTSVPTTGAEVTVSYKPRKWLVI